MLRKYVETAFDTPQMVDYLVRNTSEFVVLDNDTCILIEKQSIDKDFCFGYSTYGDDTYECAGELAEKAQSDVNYFLEHNKSKMYKKSEKYVAYCKYSNSKIFFYVPLETYKMLEDRDGLWRYRNCGEPYFLNESECQRLNDAIDKANAKFEKRLNTYLKKYGLSKVNTQIYWRDE